MNEPTSISPNLDALIERLQAIREQVGGSAKVAVAGFETDASNWIAEADMVILCEAEVCSADSMLGNLKLKKPGSPTVWLGWSKDYRTRSFLDAAANPDEYSSD